MTGGVRDMAEEFRKLPIGVQSFEKMREDGFIYVDKTRYVH
ncbi:MAG: AAA family ATPase, partial [Selenomonas sp.]|nr:AAA family ATPase [Selenomonas sp.]